jgi:hypothetical protein
MDPVPELPYRPAACEWPLIKAGHMSAPDYAQSSPKDSSCTEGGVHTCPEEGDVDNAKPVDDGVILKRNGDHYNAA